MYGVPLLVQAGRDGGRDAASLRAGVSSGAAAQAGAGAPRTARAGLPRRRAPAPAGVPGAAGHGGLSRATFEAEVGANPGAGARIVGQGDGAVTRQPRASFAWDCAGDLACGGDGTGARRSAVTRQPPVACGGEGRGLRADRGTRRHAPGSTSDPVRDGGALMLEGAA